MKNIQFFILFALFLSRIAIAQERPNVLVFLVDDLRADLGCYGNQIVKSPNIDKLAEEGVTFDKAYCQQALCAPSRMSILTGRRVENIGIHSLFTPLRSVHKSMLTMPQFFKENGYKTVSIGKVYHHTRDDVDSWSIHIPKEPNSYLDPRNIAILDSLKKANVTPAKGPAFEMADVADEAYKDGRAANHAIKALHELKDESFMMILGLSKPHLPFNAPKKYWDLYDRDKLEVPYKEAPEDMSGYALTSWHELRSYYGMPKEGQLDDETTKELIHGYYASISYIDAQIGKVMASLDELELRDNTLVMVMSDHGWKLGEYGAWCKHTNFELDTRVPLIISRQSGHEQRIVNAHSQALVENIDIFPTLAEACGLAVPELDGKSIIPLLENPDDQWDDGAYSIFARGKKIIGVSTTDGQWRYTEWRNTADNSLHSIELYPCKADYSQRAVNLAPDPAYKRTLDRMKKLMATQVLSDFDFPLLDKPRN